MTDAELKEAVETALFVGGVSSKRVGALAAAVLAAIRASGRLAPEVAGDVVDAAWDAAFAAFNAVHPGMTSLRAALEAAAPIIAAATEAKVREDLSGWADGLIEANQGSTAHQAGVRFGAKMLLERIAIRTGAAS